MEVVMLLSNLNLVMAEHLFAKAVGVALPRPS